MMKKLISAFWQICMFRMGPQDLPTSNALMIVTASAYAVAGFMVTVLNLSPIEAFFSGILDVALLAAMTQLLLWIRELNVRFLQTATALMGSGALISLLAWPLLLVQFAAGDGLAILPSMIVLGLMVWNLAVVGHILRHAIDAPFYVGILLALIFMYVSVSVMRSLFAPAV